MLLIYSKPNCVQCTQTKRWCDRKGVAYVELDVTTDNSAYETVRNLGYTSLPVVTTGSDIWAGFNPEKLKTLKG